MLSILSISASLFVIFLCHVCHKYIHAYKYVKKILFCTVQNRIFFTYLYLDNTTGMTHLKTYMHSNSPIILDYITMMVVEWNIGGMRKLMYRDKKL